MYHYQNVALHRLVDVYKHDENYFSCLYVQLQID